MTESQHFLVRLLGPRPGFPENMTAEEAAIMAEHFEHLKALTARKRILAAGPCFHPTFGLEIVTAASEAEAAAQVAEDPAVRRGVLSFELQPMHLSLMADHVPADRYAAEPSDRILQIQAILPATLEQA